MISAINQHEVEENEEFFDAFESPLELEKASSSTISRDSWKFPIAKSTTSISELREFGSIQENDFHTTGHSFERSQIRSFSLKKGPDKNDFPIKLRSEIIQPASFSNFHLAQEMNIVGEFKNENWILKFSPNSKHLAISGDSGIISIYDLNIDLSNKNELLSPTPSLVINHHTDKVTDLSWNQDSLLLSSSLDSTVKLWRNSEDPVMTYMHPCPVRSVCFHPTVPGYFATAGHDRIIRIINIATGQVEANYKATNDIYTIKYSPQGEFLAAGLSHGKVIFYQSPSFDLRLRFHSILKSKNHSGFKRFGKKVTGLEFMNNDVILVTTNDSRSRLFQYKTGNLLQKYKGAANSKHPISANFSTEFDHVICGSDKGKFVVWKTMGENSIKHPEKNNNFEALEVRKEKLPEFSIFSPKRVVLLANSKFTEKEVVEVIFTIASHKSLKIFYHFN